MPIKTPDERDYEEFSLVHKSFFFVHRDKECNIKKETGYT